MKNKALWTLNIVLGLAFIAASLGKFGDNPQAIEAMHKYGLSIPFLRFIGAAELLGGIGLLLPRTRFIAAVALMPLMLGAVYMHLTHDEASHAPVPAILLVLLCVSAWGWREERARIFARGHLLTGRS